MSQIGYSPICRHVNNHRCRCGLPNNECAIYKLGETYQILSGFNIGEIVTIVGEVKVTRMGRDSLIKYCEVLPCDSSKKQFPKSLARMGRHLSNDAREYMPELNT